MLEIILALHLNLIFDLNKDYIKINNTVISNIIKINSREDVLVDKSQPRMNPYMGKDSIVVNLLLEIPYKSNKIVARCRSPA